MDAAVVGDREVPGDVEVAEGRIVALGLTAAGTGLTAIPGFVDLQVNGFAGVDLLAADEEDVLAVDRALAATGVTAWQPTLITAAEPVTRRAAGVISRAVRTAPRTGIVGVHLEGPFLAPERLGAHPTAHRREPDGALLERLLAAGDVTSVTLAPERPGALDLVDRLVGAGVVVSLGHTEATAGQAHAAFDRGARTVTHVFNAMRRFRPREPGVAGAALTRGDVSVQAIVDGHHLAPDTVRLLWRAVGDRLVLVTDAVAAAGLGDGRTALGEVDVEVVDGVARRADGALAGSTLTMLEALRNLHRLGAPFGAAVAAASTGPARVLGRDDLGRLRRDARADVVVLDDRLEVDRVLVGGGPVEDG